MGLYLRGYYILVLLSTAMGSNHKNKIILANGVEFKDISRATLLKLLASFEEQLSMKTRMKNKVPQFVAQFANNDYSNPYIYPDMIKRTSVLTLSAPIGCILSGVMMDRYGRRVALILCQMPMAVGWFYIAYAKCAKDIIVGRIITGVGVGLTLGVPRSYISEISLPNMRGVIGSIPNLANSTGVTILAILGSFFKWDTLCYVCGCYTVALMFANCFLPESPFYVILKSTASEARDVLAKFRSKHFNLDGEVNDLKDFKNTNNLHSLTIRETAAEIFKPSACKPFAIIMIYATLMQLVGVTVVVMWAVEILEHCKSSVDSHFGNVILGITRMASALATSCLLFKVGRRPMALISAIGLGLTCIFLGTFMHNVQEYTVYPQLFLMAYIIFASLGYYTLPFLMMSELMPLQVRGILTGVVLCFVMLAIYGTNRLFPVLRFHLGLANTFVMYGAISIIGAIFLYFKLPETKGLTLQEIEEYYNARRPTLVSQRQVMAIQLKEMSRNLARSKSALVQDDWQYSDHIRRHKSKQSQITFAEHESDEKVPENKLNEIDEQESGHNLKQSKSKNLIKEYNEQDELFHEKEQNSQQEELDSETDVVEKKLLLSKLKETQEKESVESKLLDPDSRASQLDEMVRKYKKEQSEKTLGSTSTRSKQVSKENEREGAKFSHSQQKEEDKKEEGENETQQDKTVKKKKPGAGGIVFKSDSENSERKS